ncbi:MAG: hypothetical protein KC964_14655 [Candidatus Omnitrophica bacterium]|nr:hypothetical protein [Candidatus Omnitrophota bacterium]
MDASLYPAATITATPFQTVSGIGSYFISNDYGDPQATNYFIDKGYGATGELGLQNKTIKAPEIATPPPTPTPTATPEPGGYLQVEVWEKGDRRDGGALNGYNSDRCDIGFHYDPVDYYLASDYRLTEYTRLFIDPGVVIATGQESELKLYGEETAFGDWSAGIESIGLPGEEIRWLPDIAVGDRFGVPLTDHWDGIDLDLMTEYSHSSIKFNVIDYAFWAVYISNQRRKSNIAFENNVINHSKLSAYVGYDRSHLGNPNDPIAKVRIASNRIVNAGNLYSLSVYDSNAEVVNNTIVGESTHGIITKNNDENPSPVFSGNIIVGPGTCITVEDYDSSEPRFGPNIVWDWDVSTHDFSTSTLSNPVLPLEGNPRFCSSNVTGFLDSSEHFFLPQIDGDASRIPWSVSKIENIEVDYMYDANNGTHGSHGQIEIQSVNDFQVSSQNGTTLAKAHHNPRR